VKNLVVNIEKKSLFELKLYLIDFSSLGQAVITYNAGLVNQNPTFNI